MKKFLCSSLTALGLSFTLLLQAQVPVMSSYPSAPATIFLDFDGHLVSGTSWNYNGDYYCAGSGLTTAQITEIFNRVAEDYRPFNLNITTDSTKFASAPVYKRMRVLVTTTSAWYGSNAGGVALTGSFTWGDDSPAFVFSALLNSNTKYIAEAVAHEAGHTLGLFHQAYYNSNCAKLSDYYQGTGSGEIGWAPIMGVGYYRNLTLWHLGSNPYGCQEYQSDLDIITSTLNGFGYRTDDHGSTFATADQVQVMNNMFNVQGVIEKSTDIDLFAFNMLSTGRFTLDAVPYNVGAGNAGSDLDLQVSLYDQQQNLLGVYNPGTLLSSIIDTTLNPSRYYIKVQGIGNEYASAYASLGSYSLDAKTYTGGAALPLRSLVLNGSLRGDKHQLSWTIDADEQVVAQTLEVSYDARRFNTLVMPGVNDRSYTYRPSTPQTAQYRIKVLFDNGREYYSKVVTIKDDGAQKPKVISNMVTTEVVVNSPQRYEYSLVDYSGKLVSKGNVMPGNSSISLNNAARGLYIIRFFSGTQEWTEKLIKN